MHDALASEQIEIGPDGTEYVVGPGELAPRVLHVEEAAGHTVRLRFDTGEERTFSLTPYLDKGVFQRIRAAEAFRQVRVVPGGSGIAWKAGPDLSAGTLYRGSKPA